jgi:hypothetical protein
VSDFVKGVLRPVSAPFYFAGVVVLTLLGIAVAMLLRPAFASTILRFAGLENVPQAAPASFYSVRVQPLLDARCVGCHGVRMQKAQLGLESFAATMRGGKHGGVVQPGRVQDSELFVRVSLPASDDKAMPPSGKTPLTKDEVMVIRLWIAAHASGVLPVSAIKNAPRLVKPVEIPETNLEMVQRQRAALSPAVKQLQRRFPGTIDYESRDSANLEINASLVGAAFGDAELQALMPLRDRIVWADFSGTSITDASSSALASMAQLRTLRLKGTKTKDDTVRAITPLKVLRSLTVAAATPAVLAPLRQRGVAVYGGDDGR